MFCGVLAGLRTEKSILDFLKDLLNRKERIMLVRRLLVAELLNDGKTYREIQTRLGMGPATIARVERWLHFGRGGYRRALLTKRQRYHT